jgi:hypothetical protein
MVVVSVDGDRTWGRAPLGRQPSWRTFRPVTGGAARAQVLDPPCGSGLAIRLVLLTAENRLRLVLVISRIMVAEGIA